jgi:AcrR family transcriptional regulator
MTRGRGDRRSDRAVERKKEEVAEIMVEKQLPVVASQQLANALGVSRMTLHRYLKDLQLETLDPEKSAALKIELLMRIAAKMDELEGKGCLSKEEEAASRQWRNLAADFASIALPKESHHLHAHVNADGPAATRTWQRALYELRLVPEAKHNEFWERSKSLIEELSVQPTFPRKELTDGK